MQESALRGVAAVVGVAESDLGEVPEDIYPIDLAAQAAVAAADDAGVKLSEIDGVFGIIPGLMPNLSISEYLGLKPRLMGGANIGGSSFVSYLLHAAMALYSGQCQNVLIVYGSTPRADAKRGVVAPVASEFPNYQAAYRPRDPITGYALAAMRHMYEFGTAREHLAEVAVAARAWALLNPAAFSHSAGPLTVSDVLCSRMIASPLTTRDCCLVTDGGGALVLTTAERARSLRKPPAYVLGVGEATTHRQISQMPDLTRTAATMSSRNAYAMAKVKPSDIGVVELYDAFTINTIMLLEDLGFCKKGEGGPFVSGGRIAPGGALPVNTNGGGLSYCHPGMFGIFTIIEAVRQLRGEAYGRQVHGAEVALAHGNGGQLSSQVTAILGTGATL
jgi:acetyl-CoA acetyltransferase